MLLSKRLLYSETGLVIKIAPWFFQAYSLVYKLGGGGAVIYSKLSN